MKIFKSKLFYVSAFAVTLFATGAYYFATNTADAVGEGEGASVAQQNDQATPATEVPVIQGYEAVSETGFTPDVENVSHTTRPVIIYVRRVNDPILCGEPTENGTGATNVE